MKFFHLADLHFGKTVHNVSMAEQDQPYWLERFLEAADRYAPDAVVISGDIYDRKSPAPEAMALFDRLLTGLAARNIYVFAVPGNHDSAARLSHVKELLKSHRIYIAGEAERELIHVTVTDEGGPVCFWLLPYIFPKLVGDARVLDREDLSTYDEAARALLAEQPLDPSAVNILVAHQNVLAGGKAPEHSASETIIGGLGEIEASAFDAFDYVALGHIHNAQSVGRETLRYAGCPLYYDFSETGRSKALTLVTVEKDRSIRVEPVEIPLLHRMKQLEGSLEEILEAGQRETEKEHWYYQAVLRDRTLPPGIAERLRAVFGESLMNIRRELLPSEQDRAAENGGTVSGEQTVEEQFGDFFRAQRSTYPDSLQETLLRMTAEQQNRQGTEYVSDYRAVPREDSRELLDYLLANAGEEAP